MPSSTFPAGGITKFTNCRLCRNNRLETGDLWLSSTTGTILSGQTIFFDDQVLPDRVIDLGGRIVAPGLIDVQLNGAFGFNFSTLPQDTPGGSYAKCLANVNRQLISTGVTSYLPTLTSQKPQLYRQVLSHLRHRSHWTADQGAEPLGAHVEGPFLSPTKNGIHDANVLLEAKDFKDIEECYGAENLESGQGAVKMITVAPERGEMLSLIPFFKERNIIASIGHSEATFEIASEAVAAGATMITHLFNAMCPLHHRNPGIFGVLGIVETVRRPFFGIIADGIHLHSTAVKIASNLHPEGLILVTDAMHMLGLPDGSYPWANGDLQSRIAKTGPVLHLEGTEKIAGSSITLIECVNNFLAWSGATIPQAVKAASTTPATMLGCEDKKGSLNPGSDADLVILSEVTDSSTNRPQLIIDEVWKLGQRCYQREGAGVPEVTSPLSSPGNVE